MEKETDKAAVDQPAPDPGNSDPSAWTEPMSEAEQAEVRKLLGLEED